MMTIRRIATILTTGVLLAACGGPGTDTGTAAPVAPSDVTVTQQDGYVTVTWTHGGERVTGFRLTRSAAVAATSSVTRADDEAVFELGPQARSMDDTGVQVGQPYNYAVTALGAAGATSPASQAPAPVTPAAGFTLVVGTYASPLLTDAVSALGMFFYLPDDQPFDDPPTVTITGPAGWNGDEPWVASPPVAWVRDGFFWTVAGFAKAVVGTYSAELRVDGVTYTSSSELTSLDMVDEVSSVTLEVTERERVRVSFDPHPTASSYLATVYEGTDASAANVGFAPSRSTPIQVDGLDLEPGEHYVVVAAYPFDRTVPGRKVPPTRFDVGVGISPIFVIETVAITCDDPNDEPIADAALAAAIRDELGIATGPTCAQVASLERVDASGRSVRWLDGLEHAAGLESIQLDNNDITGIGPLAGLPALRWLWLGGNAIADASVVATLPDLRGLSLWLNPITTFAPLADLTELELLYIGATQATDVQHLAGLTSLRVAHLYDTGITDLSFVEGMTRLEELMLGAGNDVIDASVLADLTLLRQLDLNDNQLTDVAFLASLPNLEVLHLGGNPLVDTSPITAMTGLAALNVERLNLDSLAFLAASPELRELWAGGNDVSDVTVLGTLPNLRHVSLWSNPVINPAPFYGLSDLTFLDIGGTGAGDLAFLAASPDLELLSAWGNGVDDITALQGLELLRVINLDGNALKSLAPLVANPGIGPATHVTVPYNCLDLTPGSASRSEIDQLLARGVDLVFEPQRGDCSDPVDPEPAVLSVKIVEGDQTIAPSGSAQLTALVEVVGGAPQDVVWSTSDASVASVDGVGLVTAQQVGTASVTAASAFDPSVRDEVTVSVLGGPGPGQPAILEVRPASVILTQPGDQATLTVTAFDPTGASVWIDAASVEWRLSDASAITIAPHPTDPAAVVATAVTSVGSTVLAAALGQTLSDPVFVSVARVKPGVVLVEDAVVVFPFPEPPAHGHDDGALPPLVEVIEGTVHVAGFSEIEIADALQQVDATTLVVPVILAGDAPLAGDTLLGVGERGVMGRVEQVTTRGGYHLVHVREVGLGEVFDELELSLDGEELVSQGIARADAWALDAAEPALAPASIRERCEVKGGVTGIDVTPGLETKLYPIIDVWMGGISEIRFVLGVRGTIAGTIGIDVQGGVKLTVECEVGSPLVLSVPVPAGPLATIVSGAASLQPIIEIEAEVSAGPRLKADGTVSIEVEAHVGFDTRKRFGEMDANRIAVAAPSFEPTWILSGDGLADANVGLQVGVFLKGDVGLQLGGVVLTRTCAAARVLPRLGNACASVQRNLFLQALEAKLGIRLEAQRDRATRVINARGSDSLVRLSGVAVATLENDALNTLLERARIFAPMEYELVNAEFAAVTFYRPFEGERIDVVSPSFTGSLAPGQVLELDWGDEVELTIRGVYPEAGDTTFFDRPLVRGELWSSSNTQFTHASVNVVAEDTLVVTFTVDDDWCREPPDVLHVLGFNSMLGLATAGYMGAVDLSVECPSRYAGTISVVTTDTSNTSFSAYYPDQGNDTQEYSESIQQLVNAVLTVSIERDHDEGHWVLHVTNADLSWTYERSVSNQYGGIYYSCRDGTPMGSQTEIEWQMTEGASIYDLSRRGAAPRLIGGLLRVDGSGSRSTQSNCSGTSTEPFSLGGGNIDAILGSITLVPTGHVGPISDTSTHEESYERVWTNERYNSGYRTGGWHRDIRQTVTWSLAPL